MYRDAPPVTQGQPYTAAELAIFDQLAHRRVTRDELLTLFPNRTTGAVKKQIVEARHRLGLIDRTCTEAHARPPAALDPEDEGFEDGWERRNRRDSTKGSSQLLAAMMAA